MDADNARPGVAVTSATLMPAPQNVRTVCHKMTRAIARKQLGDYRLSAISIKRPNGHTNTHVRLDAPGGKRTTLSLGATDDLTVKAAGMSLLDAAGMKQQLDLDS